MHGIARSTIKWPRWVEAGDQIKVRSDRTRQESGAALRSLRTAAHWAPSARGGCGSACGANGGPATGNGQSREYIDRTRRTNNNGISAHGERHRAGQSGAGGRILAWALVCICYNSRGRGPSGAAAQHVSKHNTRTLCTLAPIPLATSRRRAWGGALHMASAGGAAWATEGRAAWWLWAGPRSALWHGRSAHTQQQAAGLEPRHAAR